MRFAHNFVIIFILLSSLVIAEGITVDITTDKTSYKVGDEIEVSVYMSPTTGTTKFYTTNLYVVADNLVNIEFESGKSVDVSSQTPVYSTLDFNVPSSFHPFGEGPTYGWWINGQVLSEPIELNQKTILAKYKAKVIDPLDSSANVKFSLGSLLSSVSEADDLKLSVTTNPATITIEPTITTQCKDADGKIYKAGGTPAESCFSSTYKPQFCDASGKAVDKCTTCGGCQDTICNKATDVCDTCASDTECATEHPTLPFCSNGQCVKVKPGYCDKDNSRDVCLVGSATPICDTTKNTCVECTFDNHCPDNKECKNNKCELKSCTQDSECPGGWPYCVNNICQTTPAPQCTADTDCPKYNTCVANSCVFDGLNTLLTVDAHTIDKDTSIITAHTDVGPFTVYTTLKDKSGTILAFGWEEVSGLTKGNTYDSVTEYAFQKKVDKRSIVIYNRDTKKIFLDKQYVK
jgi:hypothetical protein